jgi:hypothetical protein
LGMPNSEGMKGLDPPQSLHPLNRKPPLFGRSMDLDRQLTLEEIPEAIQCRGEILSVFRLTLTRNMRATQATLLQRAAAARGTASLPGLKLLNQIPQCARRRREIFRKKLSKHKDGQRKRTGCVLSDIHDQPAQRAHRAVRY